MQTLLPPNQATLYDLQFPSTTDTIILTKKKVFQFFWPEFCICVTKLFKILVKTQIQFLTHYSVTRMNRVSIFIPVNLFICVCVYMLNWCSLSSSSWFLFLCPFEQKDILLFPLASLAELTISQLIQYSGQ